MTTMIERRGLLVPVDEVDQVGEQPAVLPPVDGYTTKVRELEAAAAEADRIRALPTAAILARRQELTQTAGLAALDAEEHARRLTAAGVRERAELTARAASAAAKRALESDVDVRALALSRRRARWSGICWSVLVLALGYTCTSVQQFAAAGARAGSAQWAVAWAVDPVLSLLLVGLLLAKGDLSAVGVRLDGARGRRLVQWAEGVILAAVLTMNVSPVILARAPWELVVLHIAVPGAAAVAATVLPIVQQWYSDAIATLYAPPSGRPDGPINLPEQGQSAAFAEPGEAELSAADRKVLARVREALDVGELTHPLTGHAVYRRVMGGRGDKGRAYRVAAVAGGAS
jgi:hypothetical protein